LQHSAHHPYVLLKQYQEKVADALYCGIIEYLMMNMK
jgi:hypothetical protein